MDECCQNPSHICKYPMEILIEIFKYVSAKDIIRCRQVCKMWKDMVDVFSDKEDLWMKYCVSDYENVYEVVKKKSAADATWYQLYRSISLWDRLRTATEHFDEFCHSLASADEIRDCYILQNGLLLVHRRSYISFFDAFALQQTNQENVTGEYVKFIENDVELVTHSLHLHLSVIGKPYNNMLAAQRPRRQDQRFQNIKLFIIINRDLYFVDVENKIHHLNLVNRKLVELKRPSMETIVVLSNAFGVLHYLTLDRHVYAYYDEDFVLVSILDDEPDVFACIFRYNLFEQMEWYTFYTWAIQMRVQIPPGPLQGITVMKRYGNVIFIGTNLGMVFIYNKPFTKGELDLFNHEPVKEYNFRTPRQDHPLLSQEPVNAIEVIEMVNGHRLLVALPGKICVLTLTHGVNVDAHANFLARIRNLAALNYI